MKLALYFQFLLYLEIFKCLSPVVIIPGTGSSQMDAKIDKPSTVHYYCSQKADWFQLWLNTLNILPGVLDCWSDNIKLLYNEEKDIFTNNVGVETRVPYFGSTLGIEYLDRKLQSQSKVFQDLIDELVKNGYERNVSIFGAPYDFRLGPKSNPIFIQNVTNLIETAYEKNNQQKVSLISHSMGCSWSLYILNTMSQEWKDKYIKLWIPISPAYGGSVQEMKIMASGDNQGIPWVRGYQIREEQKSYESNFWLLPNEQLWDEKEALIFTPSKNYSIHDINQFFDDIGYPVAKKIYKRFDDNIQKKLLPPNVRTYPLYGIKVDTPQAYKYIKDNDWDKTPQNINGDGDGTVNTRSLRAGNKWKNMQKEEFVFREFEGQSHTGILSHQGLKDAVIKLVLD